ncbi:MAG: hypothetical protein ACTSU2_11075 [Promethearchaeota archaeon]
MIKEDTIFKIEENEFALIIKCLLDRIPILIVGNENEEAEYFAEILANLINFRNKLFFYTDFISKEEYQLILQEEESDYEIKRNIIICPSPVIKKALQIFDNFKSWILCFKVNSEKSKVSSESPNIKLSFVINQLKSKIKRFLLIENLENSIKINMVGNNFKFSELKFEKEIYRDAIKFVDISIKKMKRIFDQRISLLKNFSKELETELLDFNFEEINLKKNMFKIHILEFYNASRRAFSIINKIAILNSLNINIELSEQTLLDTISYSHASYNRILTFIKAEWGENYNLTIDNKPLKYKHDLIESLWG